MQGAIATDLLTIWIAIVILPSLLLILVPLINDILTIDVINNINTVIWNVDTLLWSTWTNILFATIWIIIVMPLIRRFFSFFGDKSNE